MVSPDIELKHNLFGALVHVLLRQFRQNSPAAGKYKRKCVTSCAILKTIKCSVHNHFDNFAAIVPGVSSRKYWLLFFYGSLMTVITIVIMIAVMIGRFPSEVITLILICNLSYRFAVVNSKLIISQRAKWKNCEHCADGVIPSLMADPWPFFCFCALKPEVYERAVVGLVVETMSIAHTTKM